MAEVSEERPILGTYYSTYLYRCMTLGLGERASLPLLAGINCSPKPYEVYYVRAKLGAR